MPALSGHHLTTRATQTRRQLTRHFQLTIYKFIHVCNTYVEDTKESKNIMSNQQKEQVMRRLQQLLQCRLVWPDDVLYFTFKKNRFYGSITSGGLIWKCTWQKPGLEPVAIFQKGSLLDGLPYVRTFESLTDWTETCIQECLDEYHTRYSSWKRVRHQRLEQPMETLFKHFQRRSLPQTNEPTVALYEQIAALQHHLEESNSTNNKWKEWFVSTNGNVPLPVADTVAKDNPTRESTNVEAQPFVLTSDTGQYVVLHRVNEVAPPECISWLKKNGPDSFKSLLGKMKQTVVFEPVTDCQQAWAPVDTNTAKHFVHNFFQST